MYPNEMRDNQEEVGLDVHQLLAKKRRKERAVSVNKKWGWNLEQVKALIHQIYGRFAPF